MCSHQCQHHHEEKSLQRLRIELSNDFPVPVSFHQFELVQYSRVVANTFGSPVPIVGSVFTAKDAGVYAITASLSWQDNASNSRNIVVAISNEDSEEQYRIANTNNVFSIKDLSSISATLYIPKGWKISVLARQVSETTINIIRSKSTFLEIIKLA